MADNCAADKRITPSSIFGCAGIIAIITFAVQRTPFDNGPNQRIDIGFPDSG
jgi:hypothetical protein